MLTLLIRHGIRLPKTNLSLPRKITDDKLNSNEKHIGGQNTYPQREIQIAEIQTQ